MIKNELRAAEELDLNFVYPDDHVEFLSHMDEISHTSWWLVGRKKDLFELCFRVVNEIMGSKKLLIPFAKWDDTNTLACFDENHRVFFHVEED